MAPAETPHDVALPSRVALHVRSSLREEEVIDFLGSLIGAAIGSAGVFWFMEAYYSRKEWRGENRWED